MHRRDFIRTAGGVAGGTAATAAAGTAAAQEDGGGGASEQPVFPSYVDGAKVGNYEDLRGQSEATIQVGAGSDGLAFDPTTVWIDAGTTVTWEWTGEGGGHNVAANDGSFNSGDPVSEGGATYEYTFESGGMFPYHCSPHEQLGMKGAIAVGSDVETEQVGGGGGGGGRPTVPDSAKSLGIAAGFAGATTLALAYFFINFGGDTRNHDQG